MCSRGIHNNSKVAEHHVVVKKSREGSQWCPQPREGCQQCPQLRDGSQQCPQPREGCQRCPQPREGVLNQGKAVNGVLNRGRVSSTKGRLSTVSSTEGGCIQDNFLNSTTSTEHTYRFLFSNSLCFQQKFWRSAYYQTSLDFL